MTIFTKRNKEEKKKLISIRDLKEGQVLMVVNAIERHSLAYGDLLLSTSRGIILLDGTHRSWMTKMGMEVQGYLVKKITIDYEV